LLDSAEDDDCIAAWTLTLAHVCVVRPDLF
jgi:hypothetical protein